ncbi:endosomal/lysosomal proton channel TMEM175-like, partial [Saccoglossus kowalevskii]
LGLNVFNNTVPVLTDKGGAIAESVPLSDAVEEFEESKTLKENMKDEVLLIVLYFFAFLFIYSSWEDHVWTYQPIENVGDTIILANLLFLVPMSLLPFSLALMAEHIDDPYAIMIFCMCVICIVLMQLIIALIAFNRPKMIKEEFKEDGKLRSSVRWTVVFCSSAVLVVAAIAGFIGYASIQAAWVFLIMLVFHDLISAACLGIYNQCGNYSFYRHRHFGKYVWHHVYQRRFDTTRIMAFADGIFSIVGTLIVLDISTSAVAVPPQDETDDLKEALRDNVHIYLCYLAIFITVGLLWFNHHSVFVFVHSVSRLMSALNKISVMFVGLLPFTFKLIAVYADNALMSVFLVYAALNVVMHVVFRTQKKNAMRTKNIDEPYTVNEPEADAGNSDRGNNDQQIGTFQQTEECHEEQTASTTYL